MPATQTAPAIARPRAGGSAFAPMRARQVAQVADLAEALDHDVNLCTLAREPDAKLQRFAAAAMAARTSLTRVCDAGTPLSETLLDLAGLPHFDAFADDAGYLAELFATLTDCDALGVRLHALRAPMCPRFHTDRVGLRLLCTYAGPGTEWLDDPHADRRLLGPGAAGCRDSASGLVRDPSLVRRVGTGAIVLLKGEGFAGNSGRGVIHRSPPEDTPRLLFSLDALTSDTAS